MPDKITIIFFGDVVGSIGRRGVKSILPVWRKKYKPDLVIANIENLAHGSGLTAKTVADIETAGIQIYTGGNHTWRKEDLSNFPELKIATPINDIRTLAQHRYQEIIIKKTKIAVVNVLGEGMMKDDSIINPFLAIRDALPEISKHLILVDMHAELTSEKRAIGFFLDGQVAVVMGTHTHVPTADAQILPGGTGYITDVGMNGAFQSVLGIDKDVIIEKFLNDSPVNHEIPETSQIEINALLLEVDIKTKKTTKIKHLREIISAKEKN
jgi:metallophosphoesterase (TIGR00282 family)